MGRKPSEARRRLFEDLRAACLDGSLRPGDPLPSARELQVRYSTSPASVVSAVAELAREGLVRTVPRVGSFVADGAGTHRSIFAMTLGASSPDLVTPFLDRVRRGFEDQVARYGGTSLVLPLEEMATLLVAGSLPSIEGMFLATSDPTIDADWLGVDDSTPVVRLWRDGAQASGRACDLLHVDNEDGGQRATQYLARQGHRRIAYLGYRHVGDRAWYHQWSDARAQGWQQVMAAMEQQVDGMIFLADAAGEGDEVAAVRQAAAALIPRRDITAVVCANDHAVIGLVDALRDYGVPPTGWPAMVGFDGRAEADRLVVTSLRLPWEGLGQRAVELLRRRASGDLAGLGEQQLLPMEVVPRVGLAELAASLPSS